MSGRVVSSVLQRAVTPDKVHRSQPWCSELCSGLWARLWSSSSLAADLKQNPKNRARRSDTKRESWMSGLNAIGKQFGSISLGGWDSFCFFLKAKS